MSNCDNGIVILHNTSAREINSYISTPNVFGDSGNGSYRYERSVRVSLFCNPYEHDSYPDHVIQCKITGFEEWESQSFNTSRDPYYWIDSRDLFVESFLVTDIPRAQMAIGGGQFATRLGHSGNVSPYHFIVLHGNINAIKQWVKTGIENTTTILESTDIYYSKTTNTLTKFVGWEIDCIIHDKSRERYPYCGSVVKGEESKGRQYISLCANLWGDCQDCCNCCSIGERFLNVWKMG